jgi:hypothetical protein
MSIDKRLIWVALGMFEKTGSQLTRADDITLDERTLKQPPFYIEPIADVGANSAKLTSLDQAFFDGRSRIAAKRTQRHGLSQNQIEL